MKVFAVMQQQDIDGYHRESNLFGIYSEESIAEKLTEGLVDSYYFDTEVDSNIPELFGYKRCYYLWLDEWNELVNTVKVPRDTVELFNTTDAPRLILGVAAKTVEEAEEKIQNLVENYKTTPEYTKIMKEMPKNLKPNLKRRRK
jgi:hypothetical protein